MLSRTQNLSKEKLDKAIEMIREHNAKATIVTTAWDELDGADILSTIEGAKDLEKELMAELEHDEEEHEHHHHHHDDEEEHEHHHHHHDDEDEHEHHHDHGEGCTCGCHDHDHHHHHADEVFTSWGLETPDSYSKEEIKGILEALENEKECGFVLRAKGMVPNTEGGWIYFDYVPGESNIRDGKPDVTGKFCVIGSKINEDNISKLFEK